MKNNIIEEKSKLLGIEIIKIYKRLFLEKEYILSKQLVRSGTSVGANVKEAIRGYSSDDFIYKMTIALKEASETEYWLELLYKGQIITEKEFNNSQILCDECIRLLVSIIKSKKMNLEKEK